MIVQKIWASGFVLWASLLVFAPTMLLAETTIKEYHITCEPADFQKIYDNPEEDIYIPITLTFGQDTWTDARMRIRGDGSRELPKKSLKIRLDSEPFVDGRDVLNFNAEYLDKSYIHSVMASYLMQASGHPCFEADYARLFLNGSFLGLYVSIENMDADFLKARDLDAKGNLYKATRDGACMSIYDDVDALWEKKTNEGLGREDLKTLIQRINEVPDAEYEAFVKATFDYEAMVNIIAMNILLGNGSTYYHNYYLYHDIRQSRKWTMIPWDMDKTFSTYGLGLRYTRSSIPWYPDNPFHERAILNENIFNDIQTRMQELATTIFTPQHLEPLIDSLCVLLTTSVAEDPTDQIESIEEWKQRVASEKEYIKRRWTEVQKQISTLPRSFRLMPTSQPFTGALTFRWQASSDPANKPLTYTFRYGTKRFAAADPLLEVTGLTDTVYTLNQPLAPGKYYWGVSVTNGEQVTEGFEAVQQFDVRAGTMLPAYSQREFDLNIYAVALYSIG